MINGSSRHDLLLNSQNFSRSTPDGGLKKPPTDALHPIIPDKACILCITATASTKLADANSLDTVIASSPGKEVHDL